MGHLTSLHMIHLLSPLTHDAKKLGQKEKEKKENMYLSPCKLFHSSHIPLELLVAKKNTS